MALDRHAEAEAELLAVLDHGDAGERLESADLLGLCRFAAERVAGR